jgi:sarcosine oxidase subunit beta
MSTTTFDTDVLVLGGGLMGTSTAFFLRQHGKSVTLLERELVGRQASGTNFGNVRRQGRELHQMPLANRARAVWGRIKARMWNSCPTATCASATPRSRRL